METRHPATAGSNQDVVQYTTYDRMGRVSFASSPYYVAAYTGTTMGNAAYAIPDLNKVGTTYAYDGLGRTISVTRPDSAITTTAFAPVCISTVCYEQTTVYDFDSFKADSDTDALGRMVISHKYDGVYSLYSTTSYGYDYLGRQTSVTLPDGSHTATVTYDLAGHQMAKSDPDLGNWSYTYDANGNQLSSIDPRGTSGTVYAGYDGLNRHLWTSANINGSSPFVSYTYDSTAGGNVGIGHRTGETFASGPSQSVTGSYSYTFDARGRATAQTIIIAGASKSYSMGYNDADQGATLTYSDGDVLSTTYDSNDWLTGISKTLSGTTTSLLDTLTYGQTLGGAIGPITDAHFGNGQYDWNSAYDQNGVAFQKTVTKISTSTTLYDEGVGRDSNLNVISRQTTVPAGVVNETYCSDFLNRLYWSGSQGTPACSFTPISSAIGGYSQDFAYDTLNRLNQGPAGSSYAYADPHHLNAFTSAGSSHTASYDLAGNMSCRATPSDTGETCSGAANGELMGYDNLGRMLTWQNKPSSPTQTAYDAYDGEGQRVWQQTASGGVSTTTTYYAGLEEVGSNGTTTTTTHYYAAGPVTAVSVNGTLSYLVSSMLGNVAEALSSSGSVSAVSLYGPWGSVIYTVGTMPTAKGFTGQYGDTITGLDYYNARFYDPTIGQFTSADLVAGGNRYAYVGNNPETMTDPTGQDKWWADPGMTSSGSGSGNTATPSPTPQQNSWGSSAVGIINAADRLAHNPLVNYFLNSASISDDIKTFFNPKASLLDKFGAGFNLDFNTRMDALYFVPDVGLLDLAAHGLEKLGLEWLVHGGAGDAVAHLSGKAAEGVGNVLKKIGASCTNSFAADTPVALAVGSATIATLKVSDRVQAYDPQTSKNKVETVDHVFINHDANLLVMTVQPVETDSKKGDASKAEKTETLHTTSEHPFLTQDRGFVSAILLHLGEKMQRADGSYGIVVTLRVVSGMAVRYNLTVHELHTYLVGND